MLFIAPILATSCRISRTNTKRRHKPRGEYINLPFYQIFTNICAYLKIQKENTLLFACWPWKMHIIYDWSLFMGMPKAAQNVIYIKRVNGLRDATPSQKHMCAYWACFICGQFNGIFRYIFLLFAQRANNAFSVWCHVFGEYSNSLNPSNIFRPWIMRVKWLVIKDFPLPNARIHFACIPGGVHVHGWTSQELMQDISCHIKFNEH